MQLPIAQTEEGEIAQSVPAQLPLNEIVQSPIAQLDTPLINMPRILAFPTPEQITHYQEYATEKAMAVFIVLGVGGAPSMPEELYLIPLISISQIQSNPSSLKQYKRELVNKWFLIEEFKE